MISTRPAPVLGLLLLAASVPALATNAGHIQGYILDESGAPLPGAIVIVTGESTVGTWHCHADDSGFYRIPGLKAAHELTVSVNAPGRAPVMRRGYRLRNEQVLRLDFRLRPAGDRSILVLVGSAIPYHRRALEGVLSTLAWEPRILEVRDGSHRSLLEVLDLVEARPDGIVAIGTTAARLARSATSDIPVVHALVPDPRRQGLVRANMCGVPANGAFEAQMALLRETAPEVRRLGALYVPDRLADALAGLRGAAGRHGLELEARSLHSLGRLDKELASLERAEIHAFYLFLDPQLWTPRVLATVGQFTSSRGILLLLPERDSFRAAHGVTYVLGFRELGAYTGGLMNNILARRTSLPAVGLTYPPPSISVLSGEELEIIEEVRGIMQASAGGPSPAGPEGIRDHP